MLIIKVLGSGCDTCQKVEAITRGAAANLGVEADFVNVGAYPEIMRYPFAGNAGFGHQREAGMCRTHPR